VRLKVKRREEKEKERESPYLQKVRRNFARFDKHTFSIVGPTLTLISVFLFTFVALNGWKERGEGGNRKNEKKQLDKALFSFFFCLNDASRKKDYHRLAFTMYILSPV